MYWPPICAVLDVGDARVNLWTCPHTDARTNPHYLCEKKDDDEEPKSPAEAGAERPAVRSPTPAHRTPPVPHIVCPSRHLTHEFLACDARSDCWRRQGDVIASDVREGWTSSACAAPLTPSPPSFWCASGGERVPYSTVCDHSPDCLDSSDEHFCVFPTCSGSAHFECSNRQVGEIDGVGLYYHISRTKCVDLFFYFFYTLFSQWECLPWEIRVAVPKEGQLQQSRATHT